MNSAEPLSNEAQIMIAIGHVCVQWARLEFTILHGIYAITRIPADKGELIFAGLDMLPRINAAIALAEHEKLPPPIKNRLKAVRTSLQSGLLDSRNQVVHGVHTGLDGKTTNLTMVRWRGEKRDKRFTPNEISKIGEDLYQLGEEATLIVDEIEAWFARPHRQKNLNNPVTD